MTDIIQYTIVASVIILAFAYVARQFRHILSGRCGGCSARDPKTPQDTTKNVL